MIPAQRMPENAFLPNTKIQDPRFPQDSWLKSWKYQDPRSKICTEVLWKILEIPRSKICTEVLWKILEIPRSKIQDFSQESCGNLGSWILVFPRFSTRLLCKSWILDLGISKILARSLVGILDLGISKILARSLVGILDLGSWYWAGMHSECIERILNAFLPKWTNKSCNLRAQIYIYIYGTPKKPNDQKATKNRHKILQISAKVR